MIESWRVSLSAPESGNGKGRPPISTHPVPKWEDMAPGLTRSGRSQKWGEEGVAKFLETGLGPKGQKADAPMPLYKMKHEDAAAIAAYLNSLE